MSRSVRTIALFNPVLVMLLLLALMAATASAEQSSAVEEPAAFMTTTQDASLDVTEPDSQNVMFVPVAAAFAPTARVATARKARCKAMSRRPSVSHSWDHVKVGSGPIQEAVRSSIQIGDCPGSARVGVLRGSYDLAGKKTKCVHVRRVYFSWTVWVTGGSSKTITRSLPCQKDTKHSGTWRIRGVSFYPPDTYGGPTYPTVFNARGSLRVDTRLGGDHTHTGGTWRIAVP